jgi:hypothetical protein
MFQIGNGPISGKRQNIFANDSSWPVLERLTCFLEYALSHWLHLANSSGTKVPVQLAACNFSSSADSKYT